MCCIFGILIPSIFGIKIMMCLAKKKLDRFNFIFYYLMLVLFSNVICTLLSYFLFGLRTNLEKSLEVSPIFSIKYIILSFIVNLFLGIIFHIIRMNVHIEVERVQ